MVATPVLKTNEKNQTSQDFIYKNAAAQACTSDIATHTGKTNSHKETPQWRFATTRLDTTSRLVMVMFVVCVTV